MVNNLDAWSLKHRLFLVKHFYQELGSYTCVRYNYEDHFKNCKDSPAFSRAVLDEVIRVFEETGSVWRTSQNFHNYAMKDIRKGNSPMKGFLPTPTDSLFKCELCEKSFLNFTNLKHHVLQSHDLEDIYKCDFCSMDFRKKYKFLRHMRSHNENISSTEPQMKSPTEFKRCQECGKFCSSSTLEEHLKTHRIDHPLKCNICGKVFTWRYGFKLHIMTHRGLPVQKKWPKCDICERKFAGERTRKLHMERAHGAGNSNQATSVNILRPQRNPQGPEIAIVEMNEMEIKKEITESNDIHIVDIPEIDTPIVPKLENTSVDTMEDNSMSLDTQDGGFSDDSESSNNFPEADDMFPPDIPQIDNKTKFCDPSGDLALCDLCGKVLSSKGSLKTHMKTHTKDKPYKCSIKGCYKAYRWAQSLDFHVLTYHAKDRGRRMKCILCDKAFVYTHMLRAHMKVDHSDEILACDFCSHVFTDKNEYDCHLREWHNFVDETTQKGESSQGADAEVDHKNLIMLSFRGKKARLKPVTCGICGKDFQYKYMLKKHIKSHAKTDEAFMCPEPGCGKSFPIEKYLKLHIATHTERRFKCADCDRTYKEFRILKWHIKKEHLKADPPYKCKYCTYTGWYSEQYKRHMRVYHENETQMTQNANV